MRQQPGFVEHELGHRGKVFERGCETQFSQVFPGFGENALRLIAQTEESFFASRPASGFGHGENILRRHVGLSTGLRVRPKRAVAAVVAAQMRERDEDFLRIADGAALVLVPNGSGGLQQGSQVGSLHQGKRLLARDTSALFGTLESGMHMRRDGAGSPTRQPRWGARDHFAHRDASMLTACLRARTHSCGATCVHPLATGVMLTPNGSKPAGRVFRLTGFG